MSGENNLLVRLEREQQEVRCLRDKLKTLQSIIDAFAGNHWWKNREGVYLGCNQGIADSLGLKKEDIVGKTDYDLPWSNHADTLIENDNTVLLSGEAKSVEEEIKSKDGSINTFLVIKAPLKSELGEIVGTVGYSVDITDRKKIEDDLKLAMKKSEAASIAKSSFIANISHDLRTPMTGVVGMLTEIGCLADDILKEPNKATELAQEMQEFVKVGKGSTDQLLTLFNEILETIKLSSGKIENSEIDFSLGRRIDSTLSLLRATAEDKSLEMKKNLSSNLPTYFLGARHNLDRILANLVSNALKFTKEGCVEVSADLASEGSTEVGDEVTVRICVSDTGIGIPKDKHETIFEHFSRINPSYEGNYKGNGLGLYAVKQYVESMNGVISVESEEGKGSKFIVELPFKVSDHSDQEEKVEPMPPLPDETKDKPNGEEVQQVAQSEEEKPVWEPAKAEEVAEATARVLVVEDNFAAAMSIKRALKRLGCEADHAKTGEESVDFAKNNQYDIVFMDIGLPGISGLEATEQIRGFSSIPIIAVTGHVDKAGVCIDAGMQELLAKPATPSSLEAMLNRHVHSKNDDIQKLNDDQTIIDWSCSKRMHEDDEEITAEIIDHVYDELIESEKVIDAAYAQKNVKRLREELHKVRGGVCYLRLPQLERGLRDFHLTLKETPITPENMGKEYQRLKIAIRSFKEAYEKGDYKNIDAQ